jgi:hypothetical protein
MKKLILMFGVLFLSLPFAFADSIDDMFAGGENQETGFERFSERNVMEAISHDAGIACHKGLCTISSVGTKYKEFVINMFGGIGNSNNGFGNGFTSGTIIAVGGQPAGSIGLNNSSGPNAGISLQIRIGDCVQSINIPRSLYYSVNRYMYGLLNEDSTTRRSFTPADEAMILFYTTIMNKANGCK